MSQLALDGIRVIDLSYSYAGPYLTKLLADMGAEVIKVESCRRPELTRPIILAENELGEQWWNRAGYFNLGQRNKYGITLDLTVPRGREILKELIKTSDVLIEAYCPRVMPNLGLDYSVLKELKPDLIMFSLSAYGQTGPYRDYTSFGTVMESMTGITQITGYPDGPPIKSGISYCDPITGLMGAGLVLAALHHRHKTGQGQHLDTSMYETGVSTIGEAIMDYTMNKRAATRQGNRHSSMAPHGCYRCKGEDEWVVIAISSDEEWQAFSGAIGEPSWTKEERFADCLSRWQNQDELNRLIEEWTRQYDHYKVMHMLQEAGVAAGPVLTNKELLFDPHLKERNFFEVVSHPQVGERPYAGMAFRMSKTPGSIRSPAPLLGEHTEQILTTLLGMSEEEMAGLKQEGVIGSVPLAARAGLTPEQTLAALATRFEQLLDVKAVIRVEPDYREQLGLEKRQP
jgi:crotonobetainyl-CoA:carnitine CoA-transferase CaiB-like acyl-CoA transferase